MTGCTQRTSEVSVGDDSDLTVAHSEFEREGKKRRPCNPNKDDKPDLRSPTHGQDVREA